MFLNCLGKHFFQALRRVHENQAVCGIPIAKLTVAVSSNALIITHNHFQGIQPAPIGSEYNFIKWYVPKDEQKYTMTR